MTVLDGTGQLAAEVAEFFYHEAALLDSRPFNAWLELYAPDATYSVPMTRGPTPSTG